jgi:hypothetical protein
VTGARLLRACGVCVAAALIQADARAQAGAPGDGSLAIGVWPQIASSPANLRVTVRLAPAPANRRLVVVFDGAEYYSSSAITLEGETNRRTYEIRYRGVPAGEYLISANLEGPRGTLASHRLAFTVLDPHERAR